MLKSENGDHQNKICKHEGIRFSNYLYSQRINSDGDIELKSEPFKIDSNKETLYFNSNASKSLNIENYEKHRNGCPLRVKNNLIKLKRKLLKIYCHMDENICETNYSLENKSDLYSVYNTLINSLNGDDDESDQQLVIETIAEKTENLIMPYLSLSNYEPPFANDQLSLSNCQELLNMLDDNSRFIENQNADKEGCDFAFDNDSYDENDLYFDNERYIFDYVDLSKENLNINNEMATSSVDDQFMLTDLEIEDEYIIEKMDFDFANNLSTQSARLSSSHISEDNEGILDNSFLINSEPSNLILDRINSPSVEIIDDNSRIKSTEILGNKNEMFSSEDTIDDLINNDNRFKTKSNNLKESPIRRGIDHYITDEPIVYDTKFNLNNDLDFDKIISDCDETIADMFDQLENENSRLEKELKIANDLVESNPKLNMHINICHSNYLLDEMDQQFSIVNRIREEQSNANKHVRIECENEDLAIETNMIFFDSFNNHVALYLKLEPSYTIDYSIIRDISLLIDFNKPILKFWQDKFYLFYNDKPEHKNLIHILKHILNKQFNDLKKRLLENYSITKHQEAIKIEIESMLNKISYLLLDIKITTLKFINYEFKMSKDDSFE